jgi:hypothetical protein
VVGMSWVVQEVRRGEVSCGMGSRYFERLR